MKKNEYNVNIICVYFIIAFFILFTIFAISQFRLLILNLDNYSNNFMLMVFAFPTVIFTIIPFSICIGFTQGLIKINIFEKLVQNKNYVKNVIIFGIFISVLTFIFSDFVLPRSIENFNILFRKTWMENEDIFINVAKSPREMSSIEIINYLSNNETNTRIYNIYLMELSKKYSVAFSALVLHFLLCLYQ